LLILYKSLQIKEKVTNLRREETTPSRTSLLIGRVIIERSGSRIPVVFANLGGKEEREGCLFDREKIRGGRGGRMMRERGKRICGGEGEGERKEREEIGC